MTRARTPRQNRIACVLSAAVCAAAPPTTQAATRYWVGPDAGNWSSRGNWSAVSGGIGGASVPGTGDTARVTATAASGFRDVTFDGNYSSPGLNGFYLHATGAATMLLNQSGTTLRSAFEHVGSNPSSSAAGRGFHFQTGGNNFVSSLILAERSVDSGSYTLAGGQLGSTT